MSSEQDVEDIIAQLQRLQLEQTELLLQLARANGARNAARRESRRATGNVVPPDATREFAIGDRVEIKNPGRFQASGGTIVKIGTSRITVQTVSGSKILRAPKNLALTI
jgi:hypothetical protein